MTACLDCFRNMVTIQKFFENTIHAKMMKNKTQNTQNFTKQHKFLRCHLSTVLQDLFS